MSKPKPDLAVLVPWLVSLMLVASKYMRPLSLVSLTSFFSDADVIQRLVGLGLGEVDVRLRIGALFEIRKPGLQRLDLRTQHGQLLCAGAGLRSCIETDGAEDQGDRGGQMGRTHGTTP